MRYNPALDGIRAIAVLAVVAFHSVAPFTRGGFIGVDVFFVLSGYLITRLLVEEHRKCGEISLVRFYARRAQRLYPTLLLMLAAFVVLAPYLWPETPRWNHAALAGLYLSDYSRAFWGAPQAIGHTWSLSVEEHFYILLPLLIPRLMRAKSPARVLIFAYLIATAWRIANFYVLGWDAAYYRFDTRLSGLFLGCLLALYKPQEIPAYLGWAAITALVALMTVAGFRGQAGLTLMTTAAELAAAAIIISSARGNSVSDALGAPLLAYTGRLSYGIYLWHYPIAYWMRDRMEWRETLLIALTASTILAAISYHAIDAPLRRRRSGQSTERPPILPIQPSRTS